MIFSAKSNVLYRDFNFHTEPISALMEIYEITYASQVNEDLWNWKYVKNPESSGIRMIVAIVDEKIVGTTTRMPFDLLVNNEVRKAYFNVDSMVHPDYRRLGIMQSLYGYTASAMPIQYSKGTNPGMYHLLKKNGYRDVLPNTFMVNYLSIPKLLLRKINIYTPKMVAPTEMYKKAGQEGEFKYVERYGQEFDEFWRRVSTGYDGILVKNSEYMNWRYKGIPNREYHAFYRKKSGRIISAVVMRIKEVSGSIVDVLWDTNERDEPFNTIRFCVDFLRRSGALKVTCWGTLEALRKSLGKNGFQDQNETPRFSVFARSDIDAFASGGKIHFVEGDGDSEYL